MLSGFRSRMKEKIHILQVKYNLSVQSLQDHISMRPKDMFARSVKVSNWTTIIVMAIVYPILGIFRGVDLHLLSGMLVHLTFFWGLVVAMVLAIQVSWLFFYFISQRFGPLNTLDFEILDKIFGPENQQDYCDTSDEDYEGTEMRRTSG